MTPKVIIHLRTKRSLLTTPGGDVIALTELAEELRKLGCQAVITHELTPNLRNFGIAHVVNITRPQESLVQLENAKKQGVKTILTTIFIDYREIEKHRGGILGLIARTIPWHWFEYMKVLGRGIINAEMHKGVLEVLTKGFLKAQKEAVTFADVIITWSKYERKIVKEVFDIDERKIKVIHDGIDLRILENAKISDFPQNAVLCVGRIELTKNQLNLIRALKLAGKLGVLVGPAGTHHKSYFRKVLKEGRGIVRWLGKMSRWELPKFYASANVYVQPSFWECTARSAMEAACLGCKIVLPDLPAQREYFEGIAHFCDPSSPESIAEAINKAFEDEKTKEEISKEAKSRFGKRKEAEQILEIYKELIG